MSVVVVTYHALADTPSPISVSPARLAADLRGLRDAGFTFVTLDACAAWLRGAAELPPLAAAITFDDGYASVAREGARLLVEAGVPATVFVIAGRVGADNRWPGQWRGIPRMPLAGAGELRELARAGVSFGAHSWSHADLPSLGPDALSREVLDAADRVEQITGAAVRSFAYPYGRFGMREAALVAGRYGCAVSARPSLVTAASDPMAIPRIDAHDLRMALSLGLAGSPLMVPYLLARRGARAVRSALDPARRPS